MFVFGELRCRNNLEGTEKTRRSVGRDLVRCMKKNPFETKDTDS